MMAIPPVASTEAGRPVIRQVTDYGYRAVKETTDVAKDILLQFKQGGTASFIFMGCSDGGREGLMSAQRYPHDFDGMVLGSPGNDWTGLMSEFWNERALASISSGTLAQADLDLMSNAALAQCVGKDGRFATDKFLNNPKACHFDITKLACNRHNAGACLAPDKVDAIKKIFDGPPDIFPAIVLASVRRTFLSNWPLWLTVQGFHAVLGNAFFANLVFPNSGWTPTS